ncbi:MAG: ATP-binding cassette domain-containing protein [Leptospiraceae bacterium]|nr:ATP-binding cassette domain-containing protein [Leptospiraceae bacterium]MDW7975616.1 ATP-binding cassette domain-containing protein [Leptospiraceae bacterium]
MIKVENLTVQFGNFTAIDQISFTVDKTMGIIGLLGPNGAGKTTTMRVLTGYLTPTSGYVEIDNIPLNGDEKQKLTIKRKIGYLPESNPLYPEMLVDEYLDFMGKSRALSDDTLKKRKDILVETLRLSSHLYTPLGLLSKGFRQRTALAATLIHDPEIIILDEPTTGLDPNQIITIREFIKSLSKEKLVILSTHILKEVQDVCNQVIIIHKGKIVANRRIEELQKSNLRVIIAKSQRDNIENTLKNLDLILNVRVQEIPNSEFKKYICELKEDRPEKLFYEIKKFDWDVIEFSPLEKSIEEIFQELTQN